MLLGRREDLALMARHFGEGLALRKNNPRIIPEAYPLAHLALTNCGLPLDAIVDEQSAPYPHGHGFEVRELTTEGYASLLRIERGRVRDREVFGPLRLHYGFFKLRARRSNYLLAREDGRVAGAVGFTVDPVAGVVSVFELIALHDHVIRFLLGELERRCREEWGAAYVEADVSAYAPRMQRTLLELSFLPAAYVPALVFDEVERLDVVKMVRLLAPLGSDRAALSPRVRAVAEVVLDRFRGRSVLPRLAQAVGQAALFAGLEQEQVLRLAGTCSVKSFAPGEVIFRQGTADKEMYVLLGGEVVIEVGGAAGPVATVTAGECLGEMGLLSGACHSATATARGEVEAAVLGHQDRAELVRQRPDIAVLIYRNLAVDMGRKLRRSSLSLPPGR
jgi:hypothetical protein